MINVANEKMSETFEMLSYFVKTLPVSSSKADMIVCYYTIQFINPSIRQALIDKFY